MPRCGSQANLVLTWSRQNAKCQSGPTPSCTNNKPESGRVTHKDFNQINQNGQSTCKSCSGIADQNGSLIVIDYQTNGYPTKINPLVGVFLLVWDWNPTCLHLPSIKVSIGHRVCWDSLSLTIIVRPQLDLWVLFPELVA